MFCGCSLPHELLLTKRQTTKLRNAFENNISTDIKLSETHIFKIIQSGRILGLLLGKIKDPLIKVAAPLAQIILAPLGITASASAIDSGIQKKLCGSETTTVLISNEEMNGIIKIVPALKDSNTLLKGIIKRIEKETVEQNNRIECC